MKVTLTKKRYNVIKCWGAFNLTIGFLALYVGYTHGVFLSLVLATVGIVSGAIMITFSKGKFIESEVIEMPVKPVDEEQLRK